MTVLVIGCGVSGLTCAVRLREAGHDVTIVARDLPPQTTSDVAAAFWYPYQAHPESVVGGWARRSREVFEQLATDRAAGVSMLTAIEVFRDPQPDPWWRDALTSFRRARRDELPTGFVDGHVFVAPAIDMRRFMPWLVARATTLGVRITRAEIPSIAAALQGHDIVINCTGLGARDVVPDPSVFPIRGQIVRIRDPGLDRVIIDDRDPRGITYVVPRGSDCILGGTAERGREDTTPTDDATRSILARCGALEARVGSAEPLEVRVGLRPGRATVRVELEHIDGKMLVHDYGHGGAGVTLSWGCAEEVVTLVKHGTRGK